jgi:hypothetical protein
LGRDAVIRIPQRSGTAGRPASSGNSRPGERASAPWRVACGDVRERLSRVRTLRCERSGSICSQGLGCCAQSHHRHQNRDPPDGPCGGVDEGGGSGGKLSVSTAWFRPLLRSASFNSVGTYSVEPDRGRFRAGRRTCRKDSEFWRRSRMGRGQAVRRGTLDPVFEGSNPSAPANSGAPSARFPARWGGSSGGSSQGCS